MQEKVEVYERRQKHVLEGEKHLREGGIHARGERVHARQGECVWERKTAHRQREKVVQERGKALRGKCEGGKV